MRKIFYYIPAVMSLLFYSVLTVVSGFRAVHPRAWGGVGILFLSVFLLCKDRWYGCVGGFLPGCALIYMSTRFTGQVIAVELPLGILFCLYYLVCGIVVYKKARR